MLLSRKTVHPVTLNCEIMLTKQCQSRLDALHTHCSVCSKILLNFCALQELPPAYMQWLLCGMWPLGASIHRYKYTFQTYLSCSTPKTPVSYKLLTCLYKVISHRVNCSYITRTYDPWSLAIALSRLKGDLFNGGLSQDRRVAPLHKSKVLGRRSWGHSGH